MKRRRNQTISSVLIMLMGVVLITLASVYSFYMARREEHNGGPTDLGTTVQDLVYHFGAKENGVHTMF